MRFVQFQKLKINTGRELTKALADPNSLVTANFLTLDLISPLVSCLVLLSHLKFVQLFLKFNESLRMFKSKMMHVGCRVLAVYLSTSR